MAYALLIVLILAPGSMALDLVDKMLDTVQDVVDVVANETQMLVDSYFDLTLAEGSRADLGWELEDRMLDTVQGFADTLANQSLPLLDLYLGLAMAEAQMTSLLDWIAEHGAKHCPIGKRIAETEIKLRKALRAAEEKQRDDPLWIFTNPEFWKIPGLRRHFPLNNLEYNLQLNKTIGTDDMLRFSMQGTPKEGESDSCITNLMHNCSVSQDCWFHITSVHPQAHGYPLTHRLLFIQIARQMQCENTPSFAYMNIATDIRNQCERILADSRFIQSLGYPKVLQDLFTEQIVLCGMEGFREFTTQEWIEKLLSWKSPSGCFSKTYIRRRKRDDVIVGGCSMHFSGLAAGALSVSIRNMLEDTRLDGCKKHFNRFSTEE